MRLEDDQNKLSVFNHDGFIIENIFCFANHPATRAHFIISFIRNWYNQNAPSFSIKHIMKKYIIWFMYVYLEKRQGLKAGTVVLLLLITLSTPAEPLLLTRQQKYLWNINDIMQFYWSVLVSALWKSIYWLPPRLLGRQFLWPGFRIPFPKDKKETEVNFVMRQTQRIGSIKSLRTSNRLLSFRLSFPENNIPSYIAEKSDKVN